MLAPWSLCARRVVHLPQIHKLTTFVRLSTGATEAEEVPVLNSDNSKYLRLSDQDLVAQCKMDTFRASGPGGQHRNKTESAVRLRHLPTGLVSQAFEDRSQHRNRDSAIQRLRRTIAIKMRSPVDLESYEVVPELAQILPLVETRRSGKQLGPNHPDYVLGLQLLLDLIEAVGGSVSEAAKKLGLSTGALSKVLTADSTLLVAVNEIRASKGLKPLR